MMEASQSFVNMDELMEGVGKRLAELTGSGHAIVTTGGAASLCVAAAAAVTAGDPELIQRLPNLSGGRDRVVMLKSGRFTYDQAIRAVGVSIVEVGTIDEMKAELDDKRTAMVALLGTDEVGLVPVVEVTGLAKAKGVPVLVDAASEYLRNPNPYLEAGATMVAYSGGKYLRGPQCTGLLIGEEPWVRAAWTNAAPHHTFARMMKVGKEEVMGILAAVEYWAAERNDDEDYEMMIQQLSTITGLVTEVEGVTAEVLAGKGEKSSPPRLEIRWPIGWIHGLDLRQKLLQSEPRIMLDDRGATDGSLFILPFSLQEGEAVVVGKSLRRMLEREREAGKDSGGAGVQGAEGERRESVVDVSGPWEVEIALHAGAVNHLLTLDQSDDRIAGRHRTTHMENEATGSIKGNQLKVVAEHPFEGTRLVYAFHGTLDGDEISGDVEIGTEGQSAPGPLNRMEYGSYRWVGRREGGHEKTQP